MGHWGWVIGGGASGAVHWGRFIGGGSFGVVQQFMKGVIDSGSSIRGHRFGVCDPSGFTMDELHLSPGVLRWRQSPRAAAPPRAAHSAAGTPVAARAVRCEQEEKRGALDTHVELFFYLFSLTHTPHSFPHVTLSHLSYISVSYIYIHFFRGRLCVCKHTLVCMGIRLWSFK